MTNKTAKPKTVSSCNCDKRMKALEDKVRDLHDMVVYLAQNPHVKVDDYLKGASYV